ncbi:MAG: response regulator transcription factor [Anaerolineae bacterium]|nr:response regulator transcription factor [Anaerolineae bacterium]
MNPTILIIEDAVDLADLLRCRLENEDYGVLTARDGIEGLQLLQRHDIHLVLLDIMMPRMDGWETCRRIRELCDVPIIIITALTDEMQAVRGLELGADDYVTKPFSLLELSARIRAALRRTRQAVVTNGAIKVDDRLLVDLKACRIVVAGETLELSPTELKILKCFLDNRGQVLTHQHLLSAVWGWEYSDQTDYLKVYIHHLRKKLEPEPQKPAYIMTERGLGYRFQIP